MILPKNILRNKFVYNWFNFSSFYGRNSIVLVHWPRTIVIVRGLLLSRECFVSRTCTFYLILYCKNPVLSWRRKTNAFIDCSRLTALIYFFLIFSSLAVVESHGVKNQKTASMWCHSSGETCKRRWRKKERPVLNYKLRWTGFVKKCRLPKWKVTAKRATFSILRFTKLHSNLRTRTPFSLFQAFG